MKKQVVLRVNDLRKTYGEKVAVDSISFHIQQGEIFALLGPNGAGKTTTLECLEGLRVPDGGRIELGVKRIGVQLQSSGLPPTITVTEAIKLFSLYHKIKPRYDLMERLGLEKQSKVQYQNLSTGQQRRLNLILALLHQPGLVILDEPTAGLDVATRHELHQLMAELRQQGVSFLLSSHDMAEVENLADRIAIMSEGRLIAEGTPKSLTASGEGYVKISVRTANGLKDYVPEGNIVKEEFHEGYRIFFTVETAKVVSGILKYIEDTQDELEDLRVERPSLEERFLELTSEGRK